MVLLLSHHIDEEAEAQRSLTIAPGYLANERQVLDSNPPQHAPGPKYLRAVVIYFRLLERKRAF